MDRNNFDCSLPPFRSLAEDETVSPRSRREFLGDVGRLALVATGASAAGEAAAAAPPGMLDNGCVIRRERLDALVAHWYPAFNEPVALRPLDLGKHGARFDVVLQRITTWTTVPETGERLKVSGLLARPAGVKGPLPVVSWQHGTILSFDQVPSNLTRLANPDYSLADGVDSLETLFNVHRFAGNGYAVIAADYLGKGPYREGRGEAYAVRDATVQTCSDVLDAGLAAMKEAGNAPTELFINGWSQGALNSQWLHQALRRKGRPIAATALQSPFNDLTESLRFWSGMDKYPSVEGAPYPPLPNWISLCIIIALGSYELQYRTKGLLDAAVRPEYRSMANKFWSDYRLDFDPSKPFPTGENLLIPGFFDRYTADANSEFLRREAGSRVTYWNYDSPIRFYYGLADEAIHPVMATRPLAPGGRLTRGIPVKKASHRATFLASLYGADVETDGAGTVLAWFESIRPSTGR